MTRRLTSVLLMLSVLPLLGADAPKGPRQSFESTSTERFDFPPGGTIRVEKSYGFLTVEGWDEREVEVTITKSTDRFEEPGWEAKAAQLFDQVRVAVVRNSDKELTISTTLPRRNSPITIVLPSGRTVVTTPIPPHHERGITLEYRIRVPRESGLVVHHRNGYVWVSDVAGVLDVRSHTGDMIVALPDPGPYSIDARTRFGSVSSDLSGKNSRPLLLGSRFRGPGSEAARRVRLRTGRGSITIKTGPPSGPFWKN